MPRNNEDNQVKQPTVSGHVEPVVSSDFERWLRKECFQQPTPEAYDLAKCAWREAQYLARDHILNVLKELSNEAIEERRRTGLLGIISGITKLNKSC